MESRLVSKSETRIETSVLNESNIGMETQHENDAKHDEKATIDEQIIALAGAIAWYDLPQLLPALRTLQWVRKNEDKIRQRMGT